MTDAEPIGEQSGKSKSGRAVGTGLSVLIVDDEPSILVTTDRLLSRKGFQVWTCQTPLLALDILSRQTFSILLVDVVMPEMDGFQVAEAARRLDPKLTIILTTGQATLDRAIQATRTGVHHFLLKPYSADELISAIQEAIKRNTALREHFELETLKPLIEVSTSLLSEVDPDILFELIVKVAWRETQADRVCLMLVGEDGQELTIRSSVGPFEQFASAALVPLENRLAGLVLETKQPQVWAREASGNAKASEITVGEGISSAISLPLETQGRVLGVLHLARLSAAPPFTRSQIDLAVILGGQAAVAIEKANLYDDLWSEQARTEALMVQATMAQEEERRRVSADVHDTVAQWLVAAQSSAEVCSAHIEKGDDVAALNELAQVRETLRRSGRELRRILMDLRPVDLNVGLAAALESLAAKFEDDAGTAVRCCISGTYRRLLAEEETLIYRIVQEALNNVRKHASASQVQINVEFEILMTRIEVVDDGQGFACDQNLGKGSRGHMGLSVMRQRAEMLRGDLSISSKPGNGTRISLQVPTPIRRARRSRGRRAKGPA